MSLGNGKTVALAGLSQRYVARLLDMVVLSPAVVFYVGSIIGAEFAVPANDVPNSSYLIRWLGLLVLVFYEPVMVARWGATVGKFAAGIRVVRFADGARVFAGRSWLRVALPSAAGVFTLGVGWVVVMFVLWFSVTWGRQWRGWHDTMAGTVVVTKESALSLRAGTSGGAGGRRARRRARRGDDPMGDSWQRFMGPGGSADADDGSTADPSV